MAEITNSKGSYTLDFLMIPNEHIGKFNEFMTQYGELSDQNILKEIVEVKSQLSTNVLNQHLRNLDAISQMNGFVNDSTKQRIEVVKRALNADTGSSKSQAFVESQFFGGTSLLLWFLILSAIWRRPYYGIGGGFGGYPGFGGGFFGGSPFF